MCLSHNIYRPECLLEKGEMLGYEYIITHNDMGEDSGWWVGFDCAHPFDLPDPDLPYASELFKQERLSFFERISARVNDSQLKKHLWTQDEVRNECMLVAAQAEKAATVKQSLTVAP